MQAHQYFQDFQLNPGFHFNILRMARHTCESYHLVSCIAILETKRWNSCGVQVSALLLGLLTLHA